MATRLFAAIDVGSFELEMGIYEFGGKNKVTRLDHVRHVIALGKDTFNNGKISYELVEELCRILGEFARIMKGYRITDYRAYATSAMREAKNSQIVLDQIRVRTGISVRVLSNSEQRFLSYKALFAVDEKFDENIQKGTAIVDVGFGSMQITLFDKNFLRSTENLPLGVLRIRERLHDMNTTVDRTTELVAETVESEFATYKKIYLKDRELKQLIGIGESILYLFRYEDDGKPLKRVSKEKFDEVYQRFLKMNERQIEEMYGVDREYAGTLLPGLIIYKIFLEASGAEAIWIPGIRMCDGMAAEYAADKKLVKFRHNFDDDILSIARTMAKRYRCQSAHSEQVEAFVLQIFDAMRRYHGLGNRERLLLRIAAIIHACGKFINIRNSNECAYNIIMATEIIGLSYLEREIIANVVRYNIRDFDYNQVRMETDFDAVENMPNNHTEVMLLIAKLTAILRLANSMDRGHKQKLKTCRMAVKADRFVVTTDYQGDITLEAVSFGQKAEFFEEIFGVRPVLKQKK